MTEDKYTELLGKRLSGEITPEELKEFNFLLDKDDSFRREYELLKSYWEEEAKPAESIDRIFQTIKERTDLSEAASDKAEVIKELNTGNNRSTVWLAAASVVLLLLAGTAYILLKRYNSTESELITWKQMKTPSRLISSVTLPDGTRVTLNSESHLRYPEKFGEKAREVYLDGEAFFEVSKNIDRPFIVHTEKFDITVLGTSFDVKSYKDDPVQETTLLQGSIKFEGKGGEAIVLKPKEKIIAGNGKFTVASQTYYRGQNGEIVETAWMSHKLLFKDQSFELLANSLSRKYGVNIRLKNDALKQATFTGEFEKESLKQALFSLQLVTPFRYETKENTVYIY